MAVSIRYIVSDVDAAIEFYTKWLGFEVQMHPSPGFAALAKGDLRLLLNVPGAGGAGTSMPDGAKPAPGGWNRFQIAVADLAETVATMKDGGCKFRSEIIRGNGGKQVLVDDPSGNAVELFEPYVKDACIAVGRNLRALTGETTASYRIESARCRLPSFV